MSNKYLNSVCFIRKYGWGNDDEQYGVRVQCLKNHIELNNKSKLNATYLYEYDALVDKRFTDDLKPMFKEGDEFGLWLEIVKELAEDSDIEWRGREDWPWDYYVNPGFIMSYELSDKIKLIDCAMEKCRAVFGYYPKTVGSWLIDTESMEYISQKYDADAFIICREQWGMDGYTLWGGPYYGGYYPSKNNMQTPAQSKENQINTPVFRMFINDPIYCYYEYANEKYNGIDYGLFTQEPAWMCGQNPDWIKWQYDNIFEGKSNDFQYIQLGQENSFEWDNRVEIGLPMQHKFVLENKDVYKYENVTVGKMGKIFKAIYETTPPRTVAALNDWAYKGNKSLWFNNKKYRVNIFSDKNEVWIRDIHIFDDSYRDEYLDTPCITHNATYDNPPIMDGIRMSGEDTKAGIYFGKGKILSYENSDKLSVELEADGKKIYMNMYDDFIELTSDDNFELEFKVKNDCEFISASDEKNISYKHKNMTYSLNIDVGKFNNNTLVSDDKKLKLSF